MQTLQISATQTSHFVYDSQKTTVLASGSYTLSTHLSVGRMPLTTLSGFPPCCLVLLSSLLQIVVFYQISYFLIIYATSIHCLNNLAKSSADVSSFVATKCAIFDNWSHIIRIMSFSTTNSSFVMKSTVKYIYGFFGISFAINFHTSAFILFFIL